MTSLQNLSTTWEPSPQRLPEVDRGTEIAMRLEAETRVLADMDSYADWLYSHCTGKPVTHTEIGYVPSSRTSMAAFVEALDVSQLLACTLKSTGGLPEIASWQLRTRYLADANTQARIERVLNEEVAPNWSDE